MAKDKVMWKGRGREMATRMPALSPMAHKSVCVVTLLAFGDHRSLAQDPVSRVWPRHP